MKIIKNNLRFDIFFYKAYADDLVIIVKHIHLPRTIKEIQKVSEKFKAYKFNWIKGKKHKGKKFSLEETINVEESYSYKYLGIVIDQYGCIYYKE